MVVGQNGAVSRADELDAGGGERRIRVLLAEDEARVRRGLRMRLEIEPDMEVVGEAGNGREVLEAARRSHPDVVLMDVAMPVVDGIAATAAVGRSLPGTVVVILSLYDDAETRGRALAAGAASFVAKHQPEREMVEEIRRAARPRGLPGAPGAGR